MNTQNVRHIDAKVDIYYGNEETSAVKNSTVSQENSPTSLDELYKFDNKLNYKTFTLEGSANKNDTSFRLGAGRALVNKFGWWGTKLSNDIAESENVYLFKSGEEPTLTVEFAGERIIRKIDLFGDDKLNEYPSRFRITMYNINDDRVYCKTFTNDECHRLILLDGGTGAYLTDTDGNLLKVKWIKLKVLAWNKPKRLSKIYRFYDDIKEEYKYDDLKEFEVIHEKVNSNSIKFGLSSDTCSVTLINKNRIFDRGYLKNMLHLNKMIVPYVNDKRLGHFFIKEWNFSQDGMFVKAQANDRLLDFQNIVFPGRMPHDKEHTEKVSFYTLFQEVLEFTRNVKNVKRFDYLIDDILKQYSVEPYLKRDSVWATLQRLSDATLSHVYIDEDDVLIVESMLLPKKKNSEQSIAPASVKVSAFMEADDGVPLLSYADGNKDILQNQNANIPITPNASIPINPSNAFAIDVPYFSDMIANEVSLSYYTKNIATSEEEIQTVHFKIDKNATRDLIITLEDYCIINDIQKNNSFIKLGLLEKINDFEYLIKITNESTELIETNIKILGQKISFEKKDMGNLENVSEVSAFRYPYAHPDCELIREEDYVEILKQRIMSCYPEQIKTATVNWRGDTKLSVNKEFELENRFKEKEKYKCTYSKISVQGGMRQDNKGILVINDS